MVVISKLNKKEIKAVTAYTLGLMALGKLNVTEFDNVIKRLKMLWLLNNEDEEALRSQISRIGVSL